MAPLAHTLCPVTSTYISGRVTILWVLTKFTGMMLSIRMPILFAWDYSCHDVVPRSRALVPATEPAAIPHNKNRGYCETLPARGVKRENNAAR